MSREATATRARPTSVTCTRQKRKDRVKDPYSETSRNVAGPRGEDPEGRSQEPVTAAKQDGLLPESLLAGNNVVRPSPPANRPTPVVRASVFGPSPTRTRSWFTGRCGRCGTHVFGAVSGLEVFPVRRRLSCGHKAIVVPARVYRSTGTLGGES